jgi:hypothetical protein
MARESAECTTLYGDNAGDRLTGEGNLALAGPAFRKMCANPFRDCCLLKGDGAPDFNANALKTLQHRSARGQVVEFYEQIRHC